ncbi:MAG: sodium:solute symporter family protein [Acidobacteriota bacterium]
MEVTTLRSLWTGWDTLILASYVPAALLVGYLYRTRSTEGLAQFVLAGRALPLSILLGTAFASWYDTWTIMGQAEEVWANGMALLFIYILPTAVFRIPLALWVGPRFRDRIPEDVYTLPDLLAHLYGQRTGNLAAPLILFQLVFSGVHLFIVAEALHLILGLPILPTVCLCAAVVMFYTMISGLWAEAVTDLFQFAVMTASAGLLAYFLLEDVGGFSGLAAALEPQDPKLLNPLGRESVPSILSWCVTALALYTAPQVYQRFGAARQGRDIKIVYLLVLALGVSYGAVMVLVGLAARALHPELPPSEGIWTTIFGALPAGARGLFMVGLAAAGMSTLDTSLLWGSTVIVKNILQDTFGLKMSEENTVRATRFMIPLLCLLLIGFTRFYEAGVARAWYYVGGFTAAVFFFPVVGGLFLSRRGSQAGWMTLTGGVLFYILWQVLAAEATEIPSNFATFVFTGLFFFGCRMRYRADGS